MHPCAPRLGSTIFIASCLALAASCSASNDGTPGGEGPGGGDSTGSGGNGANGANGSTGTGDDIGVGDNGGSFRCGDGVLTSDEACDDGNAAGADGCAADCRSVELGWSCPAAGATCFRVARCGDGAVVFPELCDDANTDPGDGCSPTCKVEVGHKCDGNPSACTPTACGDGAREGAESCEDGNTLPFDGCSSSCQAEPDCSAGSCASSCGDGLVLAEDCDDGNNIDGDGCSAACVTEPGYDCAVPQPSGSMAVPVVFRDFRAAHPDFQPDGPGRSAPVFGMVAPRLDAEKKPVYMAAANSLVTSAQSFAAWYNDVPGTNSTTVTTLTLWDTGDGRFVNRWGDDGAQWSLLSPESAHYCGNVGNEVDGEPCTSTAENTASCGDIHSPEFRGCEERGGVYWARYIEAAYDGNPLFFPVDGDAFTPAAERVPADIFPSYGDGSWLKEEGTPDHNFHFTSEIRYWFQYTAGQEYVLDFTGDDDVWVFINDRLAVDVGGIHSAVTGHLVVNAAGAGRVTYAAEGDEVIPARNVDLGLVDGGVYQIAVFHAERQTAASTFKLTLQGFATARSECTPACGDGIVSLGEQCDDGVNDGGYGECGPRCQLGELCGDGVVQDVEECDDGNNLDGDTCGSGCRNLTPR
ncbi:DUF4215 domain-containing protein [Sorangium sp. So ce1182]|uniref:DUF4215 domain-containing protein n=1 Tax=Sorangium sp. So ce1182 TaxID=3133334 RepID=UPI003F63372A